MEEKIFKSGYVTLIGRPNVGKSTLMNHLIGQKIAITSAKPQTTRNRIQTVYTDERGQIIFVDTPGLHKAKYRLDEYMQSAAKGVWSEVDLICWLIEPSASVREDEKRIAAELSGVKAPVILVINKVDKVAKEKGEHGFGFDPIFYVPELGCTTAEIPEEEKNKISHRGKAVKKLISNWKKIK